MGVGTGGVKAKPRQTKPRNADLKRYRLITCIMLNMLCNVINRLSYCVALCCAPNQP